MPRFIVLKVEGWPITLGGRSRDTSPGVTATVHDSIYHRDIKRYCSEDLRGPGPRYLKNRRAVKLAHVHADRLNEEFSTTE